MGELPSKFMLSKKVKEGSGKFKTISVNVGIKNQGAKN